MSDESMLVSIRLGNIFIKLQQYKSPYGVHFVFMSRWVDFIAWWSYNDIINTVTILQEHNNKIMAEQMMLRY